ncbi:MAG: hypothetical protein NUK62_07520 [Tenericutes bacterium]|jgi:hypothetical protein|nr:hypothetical protein [Mycoplasmatota bacterium]
MKNIIDRYIYAVTKRLPEDMRDGVKEELKANIMDMLPDNPKDEDIEKVLYELGHPRVLANNYRDKPRYLISPLYFDDYINVLKIVGIIVLIVTLVFGTIDAALNVEATTIIGAIAEITGTIISSVISGLLAAFAWVTIIFAFIDYHSKTTKKNDWKLTDLPDLPKENNAKISRTGTIIEMILGVTFSVIFITILIKYLDVIAIYNNGVIVTHIFNQDVAQSFIPFFIVSLIILIVVSLAKLYYRSWNIHLAIMYTAYQILSVIILILFVNHSMLIQPQVFEVISSYLEHSTSEVASGFANGFRVFSIVIAILVGVDLISIWFKTLKKKPVK